MPAYDPQRSRPRRRVTDDEGPAPVDELLDAAPDLAVAPDLDTDIDREVVAPTVVEPPANGARPADVPPVVVDLAPAPEPPPTAAAPGRARLLLVLVVVALALAGFVARRIGAHRRRRSD